MDPSDRELLDHPLITEVLFYPSRLEADQVPADPAGQILRLPVGADRLGAYFYHPLPDGPTVLFFHGNGEVMTDYLYGFQQQIRDAGANFLVADYRGYGLSSGSPTLSRLLEDAHAAWDYTVDVLKIESREIIIMGRSLGSLAALELAGGPGRAARALILESGIARFEDWIHRMAPILARLGLDVARLSQALATAFNNEAKIKSFPGPVLVLHCLHDEIVPVSHGRLAASWSGPSRATLQLFPCGGHNDIQMLNQDLYFQTLKDFIAGKSG